MNSFRPDLQRRLAALRLSPEREAEIVEELSAHLDDRYREHLAAGRSPGEARELTLAEIGSLTDADLLARRLAPVERRVPLDPPAFGAPARPRLLPGLWQDVRYGLRALRKNPGFATVAILMMALGTGANAAMFSVVDAVLLTSPYPDVDRVALFQQRRNGQSAGVLNATLDRVHELAAATSVFDAVSAFGLGSPILRGVAEPRRLLVECVEASMFHVLGLAPARGRPFTESDDRPGSTPVLVVSDRFWRHDLGGADDAIGRTVRVGDSMATVIGVMPPGFDSVRSISRADAIAPLSGGSTSASPICRSDGSFNVYARVRRDLTLASAQVRLDAITGGDLQLVPFIDSTVGDDRTMIVALTGAVSFVLLIACANLANMLVERAVSRTREIAVRQALGASPSRLVRQMLTESVLVSALGAIGGVTVASLTTGTLASMMPLGVPRVQHIAVNPRVLLATLLAACAAGVLAGLLPAAQVRLRLAATLTDARAATGHGRSWTRRALVVTELALAVALAIGAGLMIETFVRLRPSRPGFEAADRLVVSMQFAGPRDTPAADRVALVTRLQDELRAVPGVIDVSATTVAPFGGLGSIATIAIDGRPETQTGVRVDAPAVTPNYFSSLRIPLTAGRAFETSDAVGAEAVAIVNDTMARKYWPGRSPLGATVVVLERGGARTARRVIGVAADSLNSVRVTRASLFLPFAQSPSARADFLVHADAGRLAALPGALRTAIARVDARQVLDRIDPLPDLLAASMTPTRFVTVLMNAFAVMGVGLAAIGLAATVGWSVTRRTREIGVRLALGARPTAVVRLMLRQVVALGLAGVVLGLLLASATSRLLADRLYGVTALDRTTYAACAIVMFGIAVLAGYVPARRATRVDPLTALRAE